MSLGSFQDQVNEWSDQRKVLSSSEKSGMPWYAAGDCSVGREMHSKISLYKVGGLTLSISDGGPPGGNS